VGKLNILADDHAKAKMTEIVTHRSNDPRQTRIPNKQLIIGYTTHDNTTQRQNSENTSTIGIISQKNVDVANRHLQSTSYVERAPLHPFSYQVSEIKVQEQQLSNLHIPAIPRNPYLPTSTQKLRDTADLFMDDFIGIIQGNKSEGHVYSLFFSPL